MKIRIRMANTEKAIPRFFDFTAYGIDRLADYIDELRQQARWDAKHEQQTKAQD